jgi:two-component system NtrC family response regulator
MARVLIIDDDRVFCDVLSRAIQKHGHSTAFSVTLKDGLDSVIRGNFDAVMLDVQLPDGNGLSAIPKIRQLPNPPEIIIITGSGDPDGAELAIKCGAWDYVEKPASTNAMTLPLIRAIEYRKERQTHAPVLAIDRKGVIGNSPAIENSIGQIAQSAKGDINVLITGETGTGKELLARTIHKNSPRSDQPFIVVDCSALPESLVESILFGHGKGAFTGADRNQPGLIKQADRGTLFLDEVGELPLPLQKAFLRVLQEHRFRPVGSKEEVQSDFRLIAATNRNLDEMVQKETFRADLLYRIRAFTIQAPPLRERPEDIKDLAMYHVSRFCEKARIMMKGFSPDFFEVLEAYSWPGNIRELFHTLDSALVASHEDPILYPKNLPVHIRTVAIKANLEKSDRNHASPVPLPSPPLPEGPLPEYKEFRSQLLEEGEKHYFQRIVETARGDILDACRLSGLSRSRLYHFLQKYSLSLGGVRNQV